MAFKHIRTDDHTPHNDSRTRLLEKLLASCPAGYRFADRQGPSDLVDPSVTEQLEPLEAIGQEITRRGPFDLLRRVRTRSNGRLAKLLGSRGDDET